MLKCDSQIDYSVSCPDTLCIGTFVCVQVHIISSTREHNANDPSMFLLFRDGHYDLIYPCGGSWKKLVANTVTSGNVPVQRT